MKTLEEKLASVRKVWLGHTENAVKRAEKELISDALDKAGREGFKVAAHTLGISTDELRDKIETHDLNPTWKKRKHGN